MLAALISTSIVFPAETESKPVTGVISWIYNYEEAKKLARENGKPMFVVFRCER
jgi:hypothetical protein